MTKRFDLDVGKRRARRQWRSFIKPRIHNRKKVQILCFPGESGFEIEQVYRSLDFSDSNIWGVERDPRAASIIRQRYPHINVFVGELSEFVTEYEGPPFEIISLDYCGRFSDDKLLPLAMMIGRGLIAPRACIALNLMAGREDADEKDALRMLHTRSRIDFTDGPIRVEAALAQIKDSQHEDLSDVRSDAITQALTMTIGYVTPALRASFEWGLKKTSGTSVKLTKGTEISYGEDGAMRLSNVSIGNNNAHSTETALACKHEAIQDIVKELKDRGITAEAEYEARRLGIPHSFFEYHMGRTLVMSWYDQEGCPNFPVSMERISYISESGRRMVSDFVEVRDIDMSSIPKAVGVFVDRDNSEIHKFRLSPDPSEFKTTMDYLKFLKGVVYKYADIVARHVKTEPDFWPKRVDLGGGESIPVNEEKLKTRAVELIKKGKTTEEIIEKVPYLSVGTIRALRAHITMGTSKNRGM